MAVSKALLQFRKEGAQADAASRGLENYRSEDTTVVSVPFVTETADLNGLLETEKKQLAAKNWPAARATFERILREDENHVEAQMLLIQAISGDALR